jgi:hypothetical protein
MESRLSQSPFTQTLFQDGILAIKEPFT